MMFAPTPVHPKSESAVTCGMRVCVRVCVVCIYVYACDKHSYVCIWDIVIAYTSRLKERRADHAQDIGITEASSLHEWRIGCVTRFKVLVWGITCRLRGHTKKWKLDKFKGLQERLGPQIPFGFKPKDYKSMFQRIHRLISGLGCRVGGVALKIPCSLKPKDYKAMFQRIYHLI